MNEWVRRALPALMISTGLLLTGAAAAHAQDAEPGGITVPINVCGQGVGVLGQAEASCDTGEPEPSASPSASSTATPGPDRTPGPRQGGGDAPPAEELPLTGGSIAGLFVAALTLLAGGVGMIMLARRRATRRGAHAA